MVAFLSLMPCPIASAGGPELLGNSSQLCLMYNDIFTVAAVKLAQASVQSLSRLPNHSFTLCIAYKADRLP